MSSNGNTPKAQRTSETQDPTHQVKFLLSVWRNCDGGKINWAPVLEEFNINTQGAAAKRLERLLKTYDMKVNQVVKHLPTATKSGNDAGGEPSSAKKRCGDGAAAGPKTPAKKPRASKAKGKAVPKAEVEDDFEDDEDYDMKSPSDVVLKSDAPDDEYEEVTKEEI
ncbi:hypothetical protein F5X68DRAFT_258342 [Plectosphaerella plurivora]|uniref:Myb-like DNA-binding domain-containing protein n=1 Tax=Plectosphaerella plurivora TaxID=936078 RepID=A0A9P8VLQ4_9PEZI|nr:hypothetical protein F5X68DRAFT_258342 [Plectosphaerella plurivora]